jgi:Ca2+-binding EF-hand superfamily protein
MSSLESSDVTKHIRSLQISQLDSMSTAVGRHIAPHKGESFLKALGKMLVKGQAQTDLTDSTDPTDTSSADTSASADTFDASALFSDRDMAPPPPPPFSIDLASQFSAIDTDGSDGISLSELETALSASASTASSTTSSTTLSDAVSALFNKIDSNGDGSISLDELTQYIKSQRTIAPPPPPSIGPADQIANSGTADSSTDSAAESATAVSSTDTTTAASSATISDAVSALFTKIDSNGDGSISLDELTQYIKARQHRHHIAPPPPLSLSMSSTGSSDGSDGEKTYSEIDTNQDGVISLSELLAYFAQQESATTGTADTSSDTTTTTATATDDSTTTAAS